MAAQIQIRNKDREDKIYQGTIQDYVRNGDDLCIHVTDFKKEDDLARVTIKLPMTSAGPLAIFRWQQALAAVWGEAKNRDNGGAYVDVTTWVGRKVFVHRALVTCSGAGALASYDGWDFVPQQDFDVKAKIALAGVAGKVKRLFKKGK